MGEVKDVENEEDNEIVNAVEYKVGDDVNITSDVIVAESTRVDLSDEEEEDDEEEENSEVDAPVDLEEEEDDEEVEDTSAFSSSDDVLATDEPPRGGDDDKFGDVINQRVKATVGAAGDGFVEKKENCKRTRPHKSRDHLPSAPLATSSSSKSRAKLPSFFPP